MKRKIVYESKENATLDEIIKYYNKINEDISHSDSPDDECTPMECVITMLDYVPNDFWLRNNIRILDPCAGNGNFGAYARFKTNPDNIWYNELSVKRLNNLKKILNPTHTNLGDALSLSGDFSGTWDMVMANPPYSGGGNKNRSLSNKFIEKAIDSLNHGGYLCFVTPNNWMTYNNNNTTLRKLLNNGSFLIIDNDAKKYFPKVGSSFTIFLWQKGIMTNRTTVKNGYLKKDIQEGIIIPKDLKFLPLYLSKNVISLTMKIISNNENKLTYRCDLHNYTQKKKLADQKNDIFKYKTIHTARQTRYASIRQDIYDKWLIIIPLSTYYIPFIEHRVNTTQSVAYIAFDTKDDAKAYLERIIKPEYKLIIHLTRYGNFNNIKVLKHINFDKNIEISHDELIEINELLGLMKY
jgi:SAM-dependent methyltransferase